MHYAWWNVFGCPGTQMTDDYQNYDSSKQCLFKVHPNRRQSFFLVFGLRVPAASLALLCLRVYLLPLQGTLKLPTARTDLFMCQQPCRQLVLSISRATLHYKQSSQHNDSTAPSLHAQLGLCGYRLVAVPLAALVLCIALVCLALVSALVMVRLRTSCMGSPPQIEQTRDRGDSQRGTGAGAAGPLRTLAQIGIGIGICANRSG